ncbi:Rne/Rng family ribonuclease [Venturia nashicola]|nr:Rne/Rng family ribonuclease [Venturia nashicola]
MARAPISPESDCAVRSNRHGKSMSNEQAKDEQAKDEQPKDEQPKGEQSKDEQPKDEQPKGEQSKESKYFLQPHPYASVSIQLARLVPYRRACLLLKRMSNRNLTSLPSSTRSRTSPKVNSSPPRAPAPPQRTVTVFHELGRRQSIAKSRMELDYLKHTYAPSIHSYTAFTCYFKSSAYLSFSGIETRLDL